MRFSEHELTVAVTGAAKSVLAAKKLRRLGGDVDAAWEGLAPLERFKLLDAVGEQVLPALGALPDVEVPPGARPSFSTREIQEAVTATLGEDLGRLQRAVAVKARTALVKAALAQLPPRQGPPPLPPSSPS